MGLLDGAWLVILGVTGVGSYFFRGAEKWRSFFLGLVQLVFGVRAILVGYAGTITVAMSLEWIPNAPVSWSIFVACTCAEFLLGLALLGGMLLNAVRGSNESPARGELRRKLAVTQALLGIITIALGVWTALRALLFVLDRDAP
jgi:hypothetical protein